MLCASSGQIQKNLHTKELILEKMHFLLQMKKYQGV